MRNTFPRLTHNKLVLCSCNVASIRGTASLISVRGGVCVNMGDISQSCIFQGSSFSMDITLGTLEDRDFSGHSTGTQSYFYNFPLMPRKKIFSEDAHDIFKPFGLVTWLFACIAVLRPSLSMVRAKPTNFIRITHQHW